VDIKENIARVQERIAGACRRSGRRPEDVRLVAITKTVPPEQIREAYEAGLRDFGENRVQEAKAKRPAISDLTVTWHMVGHLQTNKARTACELFHWVHSVDSFRLAQKIDQAARQLTGEPGTASSANYRTAAEFPIPPVAGRLVRGERLPVLIEVNLGEEPAKSGARESEVVQLAEEVSRLETVEFRGLMVIPPFFENPEELRPYFRRLRDLAKKIDSRNLPNISAHELSMGMSHDFEVAIEEGATMVRVGTAIFGPRT
jgi:hypothetical protein